MNLWQVAGLGLLPGVGIFLGSLLGERINASPKIVSIALHWTAGMILSVVGVQIMPKIMEGKPLWPILLSVLAGGFFAIAIDKMIEKFSKNGSRLTIFFAVAVDMLSDGIAIGASSNVSTNFAILIVIGLFIGDFPEGLVNTTNFKEEDTSRKFRILTSLLLAILSITGAVGAFLLSAESSTNFKYSLIAFTAGMYLRAAVEDMMKESHAKFGKNIWNQMAFILGFVIYMMSSGYLGIKN